MYTKKQEAAHKRAVKLHKTHGRVIFADLVPASFAPNVKTVQVTSDPDLLTDLARGLANKLIRQAVSRYTNGSEAIGARALGLYLMTGYSVADVIRSVRQQADTSMTYGYKATVIHQWRPRDGRHVIVLRIKKGRTF
jgi:hypothetical protein